MKGRVLILVLCIFTGISACRNNTRKADGFVLADADSLPVSINSETEAFDELYRNFSSPLEIANLFQVMGVPFSPSYLASSLNAKEQNTSFDKAVYLGILGADLGYLNMYQKTGTSIGVVSSIKKLAEGLKVGQFFDFETIKRLSLSKSNLDSLLFLFVDSYTKMDQYLVESDRRQLSSLMIVGAWLEAQYYATQAVKQYPDKLLKERIGEQKNFLNDLIKILTPYCIQDKRLTEVCNYLNDIAAKYDKVKITYTRGAPVSSEKDGGLVVTQTDTSVVEMTDEQLAEIIEIIGTVRNKLILNN
jgi:hypothetical protein